MEILGLVVLIALILGLRRELGRQKAIAQRLGERVERLEWRLEELVESRAVAQRPPPAETAPVIPRTSAFAPPPVDTSAPEPRVAPAAGATADPRPVVAEPIASAALEPAGAETAAERLAAAAPVTAPAAPEAPRTPPPSRPDRLTLAVEAARGWLLGGNLVVRIGIVVLFFGGAFLLKYASDNSLLPIEFRLAGTALAATALLAVGWRLTPRRRGYGLTLEGGGVGVLYLTVFAAARLYELMPPSLAFPLLIVVCALAAVLAVRQDALALAVFGSVGGFLAPILMSTGGGGHIGLFSYYAVLDAGILAIAWFKAWRPLNLVGFVFTFAVGTAWGAAGYRPEMLASVEAFLALFVVMFVGIALLQGLRRDLAIRTPVDGTLVFGVPIAAAGLQAELIREIPFGLAWSAAGFAAFYLAIAWAIRRRAPNRVLFEAMLGIGIVFATLAVPFAFSGITTGAAWAIEGAALVGLGLRQGRAVQVWFGLAMQVAAAFAVLAPVDGAMPVLAVDALPVLNGAFLARALVAVAALFTGWAIRTLGRADILRQFSADAPLWAAAWALLWWIGAGMVEAQRFALHVAGVSSLEAFASAPRTVLDLLIAALLVFFAASAVSFEVLARRLAWEPIRWPSIALVPAATAVMLMALALPSPLGGWRGLGVGVAFATAYGLLRRQEAAVPVRLLTPLLALAFFDVSLFAVVEAHHHLAAVSPPGVWRFALAGALPGLLLLGLSRWGHRLAWPIGRHPLAHQVLAAAPFAAHLLVWGFAGLGHDGADRPLVWLPILNPLDLAVALAGLALLAFHRRLVALGRPLPPAGVATGVFVGLALLYGAFWLRLLHHGFGAPYHLPEALMPFEHQLAAVVVWCGFVFAALRATRDTATRRIATIGAGVLLAALWVWVIEAGLTADGGRWTVVPLLNPFDLVQALVWALSALWFARARQDGLPLDPHLRTLRAVAVALGFLWLNTMLLRGLHHWLDIPYTLVDLARSTLVQATLSVFWTICALIVMVGASARGLRPAWFVGAGLLGATIVKLFVFDLSHLEGVTRIVAFIGIGVLLLLIGWFSPLPPKGATSDGERAT